MVDNCQYFNHIAFYSIKNLCIGVVEPSTSGMVRGPREKQGTSKLAKILNFDLLEVPIRKIIVETPMILGKRASMWQMKNQMLDILDFDLYGKCTTHKREAIGVLSGCIIYFT